MPHCQHSHCFVCVCGGLYGKLVANGTLFRATRKSNYDFNMTSTRCAHPKPNMKAGLSGVFACDMGSECKSSKNQKFNKPLFTRLRSHMMTFFMEPEGLAAACSSTVSGHAPPAAITALLPTDPQCRASARRSEHFRILQTAVAIFVRQMQMLGGQSDMEIYLIDYARLYNRAQARVVDLMVTMENMKLSPVWRELTGRSLSLDWTPPNHAAVPARCGKSTWTG